jgi:putative transcriptional regulator
MEIDNINFSDMKKSTQNHISRIRSERGWRQLDLARRLDIYQSEVSAIERGEREPGVHLAKRIAKVLGKRVEEIF